jgi:hypothetical protein
MDKINPGVQSIQRIQVIHASSDTFVYKITKTDNDDMYVAWHEDPDAAALLEQAQTLPQFAEAIDSFAEVLIDLSSYIFTPEVKISRIVTELSAHNEPVYPEDEIVPVHSIEIGKTPVFIEAHISQRSHFD